MKLPVLWLTALLVTTGLVSCTSNTGAVAGLEVELAALEQAADGTTVATIRYRNPNVVAYNVAKATHRLTLNGRTAGTVTFESPTGVPAQSSAATQSGPVKWQSEADRPAAGSVSYGLESQLVLRLWGDTTQSLKLTASGTVPVGSR